MVKMTCMRMGKKGDSADFERCVVVSEQEIEATLCTTH